jgi:hypothetical protein
MQRLAIGAAVDRPRDLVQHGARREEFRGTVGQQSWLKVIPSPSAPTRLSTGTRTPLNATIGCWSATSCE